MKKKKIQYILSLFVCAVLIFGSILMVVQDVYFDLGRQEKLTGIVSRSDITFYTTTGRYRTTKRVFYVMLDQTNVQFAIFRDYQEYSDLLEKIKPTDTITLFYRSSSRRLNLNVFQIEKGDQVLYSAREYKGKSSIVAAITLFMGIGLLIYLIMSYHKINVAQLLLKLVK